MANRYRQSTRANSGDWKFEVRDRPANWARADHFRRSPISAAAKAGGMRAFAPVMTKSPISGNAWLTTQSRRTGLGSRITLVTGKKQGKSSKIGLEGQNLLPI